MWGLIAILIAPAVVTTREIQGVWAKEYYGSAR